MSFNIHEDKKLLDAYVMIHEDGDIEADMQAEYDNSLGKLEKCKQFIEANREKIRNIKDAYDKFIEAADQLESAVERGFPQQAADITDDLYDLADRGIIPVEDIFDAAMHNDPALVEAITQEGVDILKIKLSVENTEELVKDTLRSISF